MYLVGCSAVCSIPSARVARASNARALLVLGVSKEGKKKHGDYFTEVTREKDERSQKVKLTRTLSRSLLVCTSNTSNRARFVRVAGRLCIFSARSNVKGDDGHGLQRVRTGTMAIVRCSCCINTHYHQQAALVGKRSAIDPCTINHALLCRTLLAKVFPIENENAVSCPSKYIDRAFTRQLGSADARDLTTRNTGDYHNKRRKSGV